MAEDKAEIDRKRLLALFDMAGPDQAEELAFRLQDDLTMVARGLEQGLAQADRPVLRSQSHILMAIAGTVGAEGLHRLARQLNALAHGQGPANFAEPITEIQRRLTRLIAEVREAQSHWQART